MTRKTSQSHDPRNHETPFCSKQSTKPGSHGKFFNFHLEVSYISEMLSGIRNDVSRKPLTTGAYCSRKCRTDQTSMVGRQTTWPTFPTILLVMSRNVQCLTSIFNGFYIRRTCVFRLYLEQNNTSKLLISIITKN